MDHIITTNSGLRFNFDKPDPEMISINDLAVALGNTCRFAGHVRHYYSVAEHAILVYKLVTWAGEGAFVALAALHHDSHEAYLGDTPSPLKAKIKAEAPGMWENMEQAIDTAIAAKLGFDVSLFSHPAVKAADHMALAYEAAVLKVPDTPIYGLEPSEVKTEDEARHYVLGYPPEDAAQHFHSAHLVATKEASFWP